MTALTRESLAEWHREAAEWCAAHPGVCHLCRVKAADPARDLVEMMVPRGAFVCDDSRACRKRKQAADKLAASGSAA
jgi:hypothetical protein